MANKWMRKLGMGISVVIAISQFGAGIVFAAPENEENEPDIEIETAEIIEEETYDNTLVNLSENDIEENDEIEYWEEVEEDDNSLVKENEDVEIVYATSGKFGDNISWSLDNNGVLTLSGTGEIAYINSTTRSPFNNNKDIKKVIIKDGITNIPEYFLESCKYMESITIPSSVTSIGTAAFSGCASLKDVKLSENIITIADGLFSGCHYLTQIDIPSRAKYIGRGAFMDCANLKNVTIHDNLTFIGKQAFLRCGSLNSLNLPISINEIEREAFKSSGITDIYYDGSKFDWGKVGVRNTEDFNNITLHYSNEDESITNTVSVEVAANNSIKVIDSNHTMKLSVNRDGSFANATIYNAYGEIDKDVDSFIINIVTEYQVDGKTPKTFYTLIFTDGKWNTSYDSSKDGPYVYEGVEYFVAGGVVNQNANGLIYTGEKTGFRFLAAGHVVTNNSGLVMYNGEWFWIDNDGKCDDTYAAIVKWNGSNFLVHGGRLRTDYTGFTYNPQNRVQWYHITNGQVWGDGTITDISIEGGTITRNVVSGVVQTNNTTQNNTSQNSTNNNTQSQNINKTIRYGTPINAKTTIIYNSTITNGSATVQLAGVNTSYIGEAKLTIAKGPWLETNLDSNSMRCNLTVNISKKSDYYSETVPYTCTFIIDEKSYTITGELKHSGYDGGGSYKVYGINTTIAK